MNKLIKSDLYRSQGNLGSVAFINALRTDVSFQYMFVWRKIKMKSKINLIYRLVRKILYNHHGIEIPDSVQIGAGMQMIHPRDITINSATIIGNNCTILKGVTIGSQLRGKRQGAPKIGDNVYLGLNSSIVGGIVIGNNVLIAPNAYVNFDVPDNSIVIGNPGVIHYSESATAVYIKNIWDDNL